MESDGHLDDLVAHLGRTTLLKSAEAQRMIEEVIAYFAETVEHFVQRRHLELQSEHYKNDDIFERIAAELSTRRFAAPSLSARQIRRLIYG